MKGITDQDVLHALNQRARFFAKTLNMYLKDNGLYASQWSILFCIHRFGSMTQTEIWKYLNVEAPTVTRTLEKMEKNGWVIREQGADKRERIIKMTDKTIVEFASIRTRINNFERDLLGNFTSNEKDQLYHLLNKIGL